MDPTTLIDLAKFAEGLPKKINKDARRVRIFFPAAFNRGKELLFENPVRARAFEKECAEVMGRWADEVVRVATPRKWSFGLLSSNPFGKLREEMRDFAEKWDLDPVFCKELG